MKKKLFLLVLIILAAGGFYLYKNKVSVKTSILPSKTNSNARTPNLDRPIQITANMDENTKKLVTEKIKEIVLKLKTNANSLEDWLVLGIYRKTTGDYEGAKEAWEYVSAISPKNSISFNNLGELYAYYLKDNKKAEENYAKAIENDPSAIYIYRNFFDFYRYVAKDTVKARALLEKGIAANPSTSSDLKNLLKNLKEH